MAKRKTVALTAREPAASRVTETVANWPEARDRIWVLKDAGYHVQATDMGDSIALIIDGGKKGVPLDRIPRR